MIKCVWCIFCDKLKGTTTEVTEALCATQRKDEWQPTKSEDTSCSNELRINKNRKEDNNALGIFSGFIAND